MTNQGGNPHDVIHVGVGDKDRRDRLDDPFGEMGDLAAVEEQRPPFGADPQKEERIAQYVIREHHRGRPLSEILEDNYVTNRLTPEQVRRLLERQDVIRAVGKDTIAAMG